MNHKVLVVLMASLVLAMAFAAGLAVNPAGAEVQITMTAALRVIPDIIGINQYVTIIGVAYPLPEKYGDIYRNFTFTITKPDGTRVVIQHDSNEIAEYAFNYTCDMVGTWRVTFYWAGDKKHSSCTATTTWTVRTDPVTLPGKIETYARIATVPSEKVGLGQYIYIVGWINPPRELSGAVYPNLTFIITKPDNSQIVRKHYSDSAATHSFNVKCDQEGTWRAKLIFPGHIFQKGSESDEVTWVVEKDYIAPTYQEPPIPGRDVQLKFPIPSQYWSWWSISGPWPAATYDLAASNWNPYTYAPESPHILWRLQTSEAGLTGGDQGAYATQPVGPGTPFPIEGKSSNFVAAHGRVYYTTTEVDETNTAHFVLHCRDIYTGELIYRIFLPVNKTYPVSPTSTATIYLDISSSPKFDPKVATLVRGTFSLWVIGASNIWQVDPWTGSTLFLWSGVSGSYHKDALYLTNYNGTKGTAETGTMTKWDTRTRATVWTAKIPSVTLFWEDILIRRSSSIGGIPYGLQLWTYNATTGKVIVDGVSYGPEVYSAEITFVAGYGKYFQHGVDGRTRAFSLYDGKIVWESEPMSMPWGSFAAYAASCGLGMVFEPSHDGYLYAYDVETGQLKWKAFTEKTTETAMGVYGTWSQIIIADGKVYFSVGEHTPPNPMPRGGKLYCVNATNGELIWSLEGFYQKAGTTRYGGVHAGVLWYPTLYDGCIYFIGKGPSAVTVSASSTVVPVGSRVLIQGTITDESAGAKGTPAIADEYMTEWMEYLYMQKPMPTNAKGVPILIQAALPNGTVIEIGWTTSDIMGHYEIEWTPPEPGTYKILATFLGTKSYYPSAAQTAITVTEKAAPAGIEGISTWEAITLTLTIITLIIVVYLAVKTKKQ